MKPAELVLVMVLGSVEDERMLVSRNKKEAWIMRHIRGAGMKRPGVHILSSSCQNQKRPGVHISSSFCRNQKRPGVQILSSFCRNQKRPGVQISSSFCRNQKRAGVQILSSFCQNQERPGVQILSSFCRDQKRPGVHISSSLVMQAGQHLACSAPHSCRTDGPDHNYSRSGGNACQEVKHAKGSRSA
eukprot:496796-Pelagomonas_calceolata.AAC.6